MTENSDRIERTIELLLYAPIGVGLFLKDTAPQFVDMFVSRGRAEIDRRHDDVQQRVTTARSLGQVAMAFGPPIVRERVGKTVAEPHVEGLLGSTEADEGAPPATHTETPADPAAPAATPEWTSPAASVAAPNVDVGSGNGATAAAAASNGAPAAESASSGSADLPIPGYDALSASQVVERLIGLAPDELDAVHEYEATHRQRRTILGKIEQLAG